MGVKCRKSSSSSSLLLSCSRRLLLRFRGLLLLVLALDFVLVKSTSYTSGDAIKQSYACDPKGDTAISALPFCDRSLTDEERVEDLISRLTVREKITQLVNTAANVSRLGIPAYEWWGEGLHGVAISPSVNFGGEVPAATSFPQPILTAGSFNTALWNSIGQVVSTEGRAIYNQGRSGLTYWSPNINIVRDPRWGRTQETPGEDPKLTSTYAVYFVKGLQEGHYDGSQTPNIGGPKRLKISACCKHFTAHDLDNWKGYDRNHFDAKVTLQDLEDTYNPPFKSCVIQGQSSSLMCSYNRLNGIPMCTHYELLTLTVRNSWGFNGYIMSDCDAVALIHDFIYYAPTPEDAVSYVMLAGMDLNCGTTVLNHAQGALDKGLIWEELINMHLRNLFAVRMRLGMFDGDPGTLPFGSLGPSDVCTTDHQNLALEAARQSIVLLKNDRTTLPWKKIKRFKLAVIGPHGNSTQEMLGNYEGIPCKFISPLDGITALFGVDGENVIYAPGCADASCEDGSLIQSAATAASEADAVVLFVGLSQAQESEGRDRESLLLPGMQQELISTVVDAVSGRPIVVVILSGGPVDVSFIKEDDRVGSILWAGYPGQAGGQAIAEVIFGDVNPAGRIALSWYHENYTQMDMSNMQMRPDLSLGYPGRTHRFFTGSPIWEFGYGLSYSQFSHVIVEAPSTITAPTLHQQLCHKDASNSLMAMECLTEDTDACEDLNFKLKVLVKNEGPMDGDHSVLLYSKSPLSGSNGIPLKQLLGLQRIYLDSGSDREVIFLVHFCTDLGTVKVDGLRTLDIGTHTIIAGTAHHPIVVETAHSHLEQS